MLKSQEERFKVLSAIYYLIMERKISMPFPDNKIMELLSINEKDLFLDLRYLDEGGYINADSKVDFLILIRGITPRGVDFIEDPFKAEGAIIISSNINTANITMDHTHTEGETIKIIQQNTTNIFNENIVELKGKVKNLEKLVENIDSSNKNELKKSLEEANKKLEAKDRTGFIIKIKNSFRKLFEELRPKSFKEWMELTLESWSIAKLLV